MIMNIYSMAEKNQWHIFYYPSAPSANKLSLNFINSMIFIFRWMGIYHFQKILRTMEDYMPHSKWARCLYYNNLLYYNHNIHVPVPSIIPPTIKGLSYDGRDKSSTNAPISPIHSWSVVLHHIWSGKPTHWNMTFNNFQIACHVFNNNFVEFSISALNLNFHDI